VKDSRSVSEDYGEGVAPPKVIPIDPDDTYRAEFPNYVTFSIIGIEELSNLDMTLVFIQSSRGTLVVISELAVGNDHLFHFISRIRQQRDCAIFVI
jgi:hypothetical protein